MGHDVPKQITRCLKQIGEGRTSAVSELLPLVYDELRQLAAVRLASERPDHTLQPTALVHEVYLKLVNQERASWTGRAHFLAVAAEAIRRILIDHARKRLADKRAPPQRVTLAAVADTAGRAGVDFLSLNDALDRLASHSARQARVVELRFFAGMTVDETAHVLGVSSTTVKDDWRFARVWLEQQMAEAE